MNKSTIYYKKRIKPNKPIMIVGLPGIGNVGSLVGEHLKTELETERLGTLYSPHFPHQAIMLPNGKLRLVNNRFYYYKKSKKFKGTNDIIILVGDFQAVSPEGQYEVNEMIVRFFKKMGGKRIYTIGGYSTSNSIIQNPKVYGVTPNSKLIKELTKKGIIFGQAAGMIYGSAGLIPTFAKKHEIESACIMGETGLLEVDANSAKSVLEVLKKILEVDINLNNIEKIRQRTNEMLKELDVAANQMGQEQLPPKDNLNYIR